MTLNTEYLGLTLNSKGEINGFFDKESGRNYIPEGKNAPLMSVRIDGNLIHPEVAVLDRGKEILSLSYAQDVTAQIRCKSKKTHLTFELLSITNPDDIDLVIWGPYPSTIKKIIGETIGVVRGETYAIGLQALNPRTLAGYPWNENDCMPQVDIFEQDDLSDLSEKGKRHVLYRVEGAKPTPFGSTLQAFCRNRNTMRVIENWGHQRYTALPFADGGIVGSKIALFGCPVDKALSTLGSIEVEEGLPHPRIDGQWGKTAGSAAAAYIIMEFGVQDIKRAVDITKKAGLRYLYHPDPFENWGHFDLKRKFFPDGTDSLRFCVKQAEKKGVMVGLHTLSNFITTNDPYVTPVPDDRLAKVGTTRITKDVSEQAAEIFIESPIFFNQYKNNHLKTAVINGELVRYQKVTEQPPWQLLGCQRGAFDTAVKSHKAGSDIAKLADHAYKVFLTNPELSLEVAKNIADLFNRTGLRQISFDGLEGNRSTGMGNYGEILFTLNWFNNLSEDITSHFIADASRTSHYFWHIYTRMNWGEPWYAGFRESQTDYRIKNQAYFQRNLMPGMLGWFKMSAETSVEDIEWMLARSAAYDAGYAFVTSFETLAENHHSNKILQRLGEWEQVRMARLLDDRQKEKMKNIKNEFFLKLVKNGSWNLYQVFTYKYLYKHFDRQPGESTGATFTFNNPSAKQNFHLRITAAEGNIQNVRLELDNYRTLVLPRGLKKGESFQFSGVNRGVIYNSNWEEKATVDVDAGFFNVNSGDHRIHFDCRFTGSNEARAKIEVRLFGPPERIKTKKNQHQINGGGER